MNIAVVCTAILASLIFLLGMNVSRIRGQRERSGETLFPTDPGDALFKAVRTHGNAAEYVPTLAVLILFTGLDHPAVWVVACIVGATASRLLHVYGMLTSATLATRGIARYAGALGTYLFGLGLVLAALIQPLPAGG
jgi:uncharacterized membrane protein YecN with MAPEG domain